MTYDFKTKPFEHQRAELENHGGDEYRGLFWEMGCGKTKPVIDDTAKLFTEDKVDGLVVIAPNGVHQNWVNEELPVHLPDAVAAQTRCHIWFSTDTKTHMRSFNLALSHPGLAVLVMSYEALRTERGRKAWKSFLTKRRCMYVLDESQKAKSPGAKVTKRILGSASATAAPYRRALSGTPVDNSPFDVYSQLKFLKPDIWHDLGIHSFSTFKSYFGIWESFVNSATGKAFSTCVAYRNLDELYDKLHLVGSRVTKADVLPNLPPKTYSKRFFDMSSEQKKLYKQIKDDYLAEYAGGMITAELPIVRLLRFQQIVCGYLPKDDLNPELRDIPGPNPRLRELSEIVSDLPPDHKLIIWARFNRDIDLIRTVPQIAKSHVMVNGSVTGPPRAEALKKFQKGDTQFLVANPAAIGTGVTLHSAKTVVYYSNSFKLSERLQSEDRAHRIGLLHPVHYIDLVCNNSVDKRIIESLRNKVDVASKITGDQLAEWI